MANDASNSASDDDDEPALKRQCVEESRLSIRRKKLETRYVDQYFYDRERSERRRVVRIEYEPEDAVWVAVSSLEEGEEQAYYLNAASKMDEMIADERERSRQKEENKGVSCPFVPDGKGIEVSWEIVEEDEEEAKNIWWRATVDERKGTRTIGDGEEEVDLEVFSISYEARPELGEPEIVKRDVCFLSSRALFDSEEEQVMQWRIEGSSDALVPDLTADFEKEDDHIVRTTIDDLVDNTLADAIEGKFKRKFDSLARDSQCIVADKMRHARTTIKAAFQAHVDTKKISMQTPGYTEPPRSTNNIIVDDVTLTPADVAAVIDSLKNNDISSPKRQTSS